MNSHWGTDVRNGCVGRDEGGGHGQVPVEFSVRRLSVSDRGDDRTPAF